MVAILGVLHEGVLLESLQYYIFCIGALSAWGMTRVNNVPVSKILRKTFETINFLAVVPPVLAQFYFSIRTLLAMYNLDNHLKATATSSEMIAESKGTV